MRQQKILSYWSVDIRCYIVLIGIQAWRSEGIRMAFMQHYVAARLVKLDSLSYDGSEQA